MSREIEIGGVLVDLESFLNDLVGRDVSACKLLVNQLREDHAREDGDSLGLFVLAKAFRASVLRYLESAHFASDPKSAEEAWNDTLVRVFGRI